MLGSGLGPIFGFVLGLGRFRVQPDPTDLKKIIIIKYKNKIKTTTTTQLMYQTSETMVENKLNLTNPL